MLHPALAEKVKKMIDICTAEGLTVDIFQGYRSFEEQQKLYLQRPKVTNASSGKSWHNYGLAVDLVFKDNGKWSWKDTHNWSRLGEIGEAFGLEWGGRWKGIVDKPHFQLRGGLSIVKALILYRQGGLDRVWGYMNET